MSKNNFSNIPEQYRPISPWSYFGHGILYAIPILGLIFLVIHSLSSVRNVNLRNYARSYFCGLVLVLVVLGIIIGVSAGAGVVQAVVDAIKGATNG